MKTLTVTLELLDETVVSERAATEGGHRCLDYIPGANLLGWSAAQLYSTLSRHEAWTIFHSGKVRFGNALPLTASGSVARPMPLCWHENKGGNRAVKDDKIQATSLLNLLHCEPEAGIQPRQLRAGYVTERGEVVKPRRVMRMKTAIDPDQGRAANAQLFGYEAIVAGTRFQAILSSDDDVDSDLLEKLRDSLNRLIRLGRSRSAQYGGVQASTDGWRENSLECKHQSSLILWLQSDLALVNEAGAPTLVPAAHLLGLPPGARYQAERSFVRFRRYAPYNQARRSHDVERQVISQGSVLCYALDADSNFEPALLNKMAEGIGLYRESGLGQVLINSAFLTQASPPFASFPEQAVTEQETKPSRPSGRLVDWLDAHSGSNQARTEAQKWAEEKVAELGKLYRQACAYNGLAVCQLAGPGRSQWGRVEEAAKQQPAELLSALFDGDDAICKAKDEDWAAHYGAAKDATYIDWLKRQSEEANGHGDAAYRMALLADQAQKLVARLGQGE